MQLFDTVALLHDNPEKHLQRGQVGTIVEIYAPDMFEVEFMTAQGKTYALETLQQSELMLLHYYSLEQAA
jgi:hypothetical protein